MIWFDLIWFDLIYVDLQSPQLVEHLCSARTIWDLNKVIIIIVVVIIIIMTASALALRSEWLLTDLNCPQVSTSVLSFIWALYGDLSRLLRVMFVTCISFSISMRNAEETFAATFFVF